MSQPGKKPSGPRDFRGKTRRLDDLAGRLARETLGNKRALVAQMMAAWPTVIGPAFADQTWPVQVRFGRSREQGATLLLGCSAVLAPVLAHSLDQVAERVNLWLGYDGITRVQIVQGVMPARPTAPARPPPPLPTTPPSAQAALEEIEDEEMRAALAGLAQRLLRPRDP